MSPLWRDEIRILLSPSRVCLTRMRRGIRPVCVAETRHAVEGNLFDWRPALSVLNSCLAAVESRGANARVIITSHWARYAIVPWSDNITNEEERLAHARICLAGIYGSATEDWSVCLSEAAPGKARIACAIQAELLAQLRATLESHQARMVSVQSHLIAAYNGWRHRLPPDVGWFVCIDEGSLAAARLSPSGWDRVYSARIGADWPLELHRLSAFAKLALQDAGDGRVFIDAPARLRRLAGEHEAGIEWLDDAREGPLAAEDSSALERLYR